MPDKVNIAFAEIGSGPALVNTPNWMNRLEPDRTSPILARWIEAASRSHQLIRYGARGCGLSDRDVEALNFDGNKLDFDAVVDAAGVERFALFGASQGASDHARPLSL